MRTILLLLLLAVALPAQAQTYRCVDAKGKTNFTDKAAPGCKPVPGSTGARKSPAPAAGPSKAKAAPAKEAPLTAEQLASRCKTMNDELQWLDSPAGKGVQNHAARVGQVKRAMRQCR